MIKEETEINKQIKSLKGQLNKTNDDENLTKSLIEHKQKLNEILDKNISGHILRSKATHIENNEKNTKYFANLEKKTSRKENHI